MSAVKKSFEAVMVSDDRLKCSCSSDVQKELLKSVTKCIEITELFEPLFFDKPKEQLAALRQISEMIKKIQQCEFAVKLLENCKISENEGISENKEFDSMIHEYRMEHIRTFSEFSYLLYEIRDKKLFRPENLKI